MKIKSIIILLYFVSNINSQTINNKYFICAELKYTHQKYNGIELGVGISKYIYNFNETTEIGIYPSCEYKFIKNKSIFAPKFGLGMEQYYPKLKGFGYNLKFSGAIYEPTKTKDFRLLPEIGINYLGIINLNYSYSIPLNTKTVSEIGNHLITVSFIWNFERNFLNFTDVFGFW